MYYHCVFLTQNSAFNYVISMLHLRLLYADKNFLLTYLLAELTAELYVLLISLCYRVHCVLSLYFPLTVVNLVVCTQASQSTSIVLSIH